MTKGLKIPPEQRSFAARGGRSVEDAAAADRREALAGQSVGRRSDVSMNLEEIGRYGNLRQNMTSQLKIQDR